MRHHVKSALITSLILIAVCSQSQENGSPKDNAEIKRITSEIKSLQQQISDDSIDLGIAKTRLRKLNNELVILKGGDEKVSDEAGRKKEEALDKKEALLADQDNEVTRIQKRIKQLESEKGVEVNESVANEKINRLNLDLKDARKKASETRSEFETMQKQKEGRLLSPER